MEHCTVKFVKELNANSSVRAKATDFKFGMHALMDNPDMGPENENFKKGQWPWSRDGVLGGDMHPNERLVLTCVVLFD